MSNLYALLSLFFFLLALVGIAGIGVGVVIGLALGERRETRPIQSPAPATISSEVRAAMTAPMFVPPSAASGSAEETAHVSGALEAPVQQPPAPRRSAPAWTIALAVAVMILCCCCTLLLAVMASTR